MSETSTSKELDMVVKQAVKPHEAVGFPVSIKDSKFQVGNPTGALGRGNKTVESLLNAPDNVALITGVEQKTAGLLAGHLEQRFGQRQDCQDLIMYGPAREGTIED